MSLIGGSSITHSWRYDMIQGTVTLAAGTVIEVTDASIVRGSVSISMSTCRDSSFTFGTFNYAVLKIGIIDDEALLHDFAGAEITLQKVDGEGASAVTTGLGTYYVDGTKTKRRKTAVMLTAYDKTSAFDTEISDTVKGSTHTPYTAISAACNAIGVTLVPVNPQDFPNSSASFKPSSRSIQTYRDLVMWAVQLMCANAVINRIGRLEIRSARFVSGSPADYISDGTDRMDIEFADTRVFIKYLSAYSAGVLKTYSSNISPSEAQTRAGMLTLPYNPLLEGKTEEECDTIYTAILGHLNQTSPGTIFTQRRIVARMFDNPGIKLGDKVRFGGGKMDVGYSHVIAVPASIVRKYRGVTTVTCAAPAAVSAEVSDNANT